MGEMGEERSGRCFELDVNVESWKSMFEVEGTCRVETRA